VTFVTRDMWRDSFHEERSFKNESGNDCMRLVQRQNTMFEVQRVHCGFIISG